MRTLLPLLALSIFGCGQQKDTEMWFGKVAAKDYDKSSCSHDYCCAESCSTSTDANGNETETCVCTATCYDHDYDYYWGFKYDWDLDGSADRFSYDGDPENDGWFAGMEGRSLTLQSCGDCSLRGNNKRVWNETRIGDSVAVPHTFDNYLLVDEDSLHLNVANYQPTVPVPSYPQGHDFHRFNSAVNVGTQMDAAGWNSFLAKKNTSLGHKMQVHMMVVATTDQNPQYAAALEEAWKLGKKNNAIFVFGVDNEGFIQWSSLVSFSGVEMMRIRVRDDFPGLHINASETRDLVLSTTVEHYERDPMADKEYLMRNTWWYRWRWFIHAPLLLALGLLLVLVATGSIGGAGAYAVTRRRRRY
jgi:hypothetical protein